MCAWPDVQSCLPNKLQGCMVSPSIQLPLHRDEMILYTVSLASFDMRSVAVYRALFSAAAIAQSLKCMSISRVETCVDTVAKLPGLPCQVRSDNRPVRLGLYAQ